MPKSCRVSESRRVVTAHADLVDDITTVMKQHYAERLTTAAIADRIGYSPLLVRHVFRNTVGMPLRSYLTEIRMERARQLLQASEKVEAVALLVGYRSKRQFIRQFKARVGVLPSVFRHDQTAAHSDAVGGQRSLGALRTLGHDPRQILVVPVGETGRADS